jgi:hypothetical protein
MPEANIAINKLRRIEESWEKLKGYKTNTPEYRALIKQIAVLSMEYQALVDSAKGQI